MSHRLQKKIIIITFLFLPLLLLAAFWYYPAFKLIQQSFTDWDGLSKYKYIGFDNYISVFKHPDIYTILANNFAHACAAFSQIVIGLYLAVILNAKIKASNFFRSVIFMPYILNLAAIAYMFSFLYSFEYSPINIIIRYFGTDDSGIRWLSNNYSSNFSLALVGTWIYTGFAMVIFLGALQSVPQELYEASELDGANFLQKLRYITVPSIKTVIELQIFLAINASFQVFMQPLLISQGGPGIRTETLVSYTVKTAFEFKNYGKASAMGVMLMFVIFAAVSLQRHLMNRKESTL
jgi:raffinose/stachyose/melibiose transport system permease protein